jgi:hypothetical protein
MDRRGLVALLAGLALAAFPGIRAETVDTKSKAALGCACCCAACACPACSCDANTEARQGCDCCGRAACCPEEAEAAVAPPCCA